MAVQVVTKSGIVCRDIDVLSEMRSVVNITITTFNDSISGRLEPGAPLPSRRLQAIKKLSDSGIPVSVRVDPIIPGINGSDLSDVISEASNAGARHITSSTFKARPDSMERLSVAFPEETEALRFMFAKGDRYGGSLYLPRELRQGIMHDVEIVAIKEGMSFAACREGLNKRQRVSCDGSHLIRMI